jgi:hypothetical protein
MNHTITFAEEMTDFLVTYKFSIIAMTTSGIFGLLGFIMHLKCCGRCVRRVCRVKAAVVAEEAPEDQVIVDFGKDPTPPSSGEEADSNPKPSKKRKRSASKISYGNLATKIVKTAKKFVLSDTEQSEGEEVDLEEAELVPLAKAV